MLNRRAGGGTHERPSYAVMSSHYGSNRRPLESPVPMTRLRVLRRRKRARNGQEKRTHQHRRLESG